MICAVIDKLLVVYVINDIPVITVDIYTPSHRLLFWLGKLNAQGFDSILYFIRGIMTTNP